MEDKMAKISIEEFYRDLDMETRRLVEWFNKTESPADSCKDFIYQLVTELGESHFTTIGILTEALLEWRNRSDEVLREEAEKNN